MHCCLLQVHSGAIDQMIFALGGRALALSATVRFSANRSCPFLSGLATQGELLACRWVTVAEVRSLMAWETTLRLVASQLRHGAQAEAGNSHPWVPCIWVSKTPVLQAETAPLRFRYYLEVC